MSADRERSEDAEERRDDGGQESGDGAGQRNDGKQEDGRRESGDGRRGSDSDQQTDSGSEQQDDDGSDRDGGSEQQGGDSDTSTTKQDPPPTMLEWGVRIASLVALLALTGYILFMAFQPPKETRFEYTVQRDDIAERDGEWVVPVRVKNTGSDSLLDLEVKLALVAADGSVVEEEVLSIPLIGRGESRRTVYWFARDPAPYELRFDVTGYKLP